MTIEVNNHNELGLQLQQVLGGSVTFKQQSPVIRWSHLGCDIEHVVNFLNAILKKDLPAIPGAEKKDWVTGGGSFIEIDSVLFDCYHPKLVLQCLKSHESELGKIKTGPRIGPHRSYRQDFNR